MSDNTQHSIDWGRVVTYHNMIDREFDILCVETKAQDIYGSVYDSIILYDAGMYVYYKYLRSVPYTKYVAVHYSLHITFLYPSSSISQKINIDDVSKLREPGDSVYTWGVDQYIQPSIKLDSSVFSMYHEKSKFPVAKRRIKII